jgi:hypothetical protein
MLCAFNNLYVEINKYLSNEDNNVLLSLLNTNKNFTDLKKKFYIWSLNEKYSLLFYEKNNKFYNDFISLYENNKKIKLNLNCCDKITDKGFNGLQHLSKIHTLII